MIIALNFTFTNFFYSHNFEFNDIQLRKIKKKLKNVMEMILMVSALKTSRITRNSL